MRRILRLALLLWVARWLGREVAAHLESRRRVVE